MIDLPEKLRLKRQGLSSLLGLTLDGSRVEGVALRRINGSVQLLQSFSFTLSLDPLTADPELVGREIRNHLDAAEVRERHCVVGLPLKWALTTHVEVPELPEEDVASFLQIEAERGFPCDLATLWTATSRSEISKGKHRAMVIGIPRGHIALLEQVMRAARLKPLGFSLGILALQPPDAESSRGVLALAIGDTHVGLQISSGGGLVALRTLEGALTVEGSRRLLDADLVAREVRITLGQLPADLRDSIRHLRIFGPRDLGQQLADELELRLESMGLKMELVSRYAASDFKVQIPPETPVSAAFSLAASKLAGDSAHLNFLPPKVTAWQQISSRYTSGKLRFAGAVAAVLLLVLGGLFGFQQWELMRLRSQWQAMASEVQELQQLQEQIRQYRPWFDDSFQAMSILRQLTTAFPEDGVVAAKTVEIRDLTTVTCTGTARDNQSLLKTLDRLRAAGGVSDLEVDQIRGRSPMQFTFDFRWSGGGRNEN